jgi:hypothetical protein
MVQVLHPVLRPVLTGTMHAATGHVTVPDTRTRLALEVRVAAEDLAGRVDRDELTLDEEIRLSEAIDFAVEAVLPLVIHVLDDVLTPRLEALPLHARLTLARARRRREFGLD